MPISFNGNSPQSITFNGNQVDYVYYNGDLVWQSWLPLTYTYTGNSSERTITSNGHEYKIITLTSNGTLTFNRQATIDIWACGGGSNGMTPVMIGSQYRGGGPGGAGAYCNEVDGQSVTVLNVVIGPANTASGTVITGDASLTAAGVSNNRNGGTGGGGSRVVDTSSTTIKNASAGSGDGKSKYPFGDTTNFDPHCAGGGGGVLRTSASYRNGGAGGTNGGSGGGSSSSSSSSQSRASGGNKGGGAGATYSNNGSNATFYGSGGGGCSGDQGSYKSGGSGYQGVCYIKIPIEEF